MPRHLVRIQSSNFHALPAGCSKSARYLVLRQEGRWLRLGREGRRHVPMVARHCNVHHWCWFRLRSDRACSSWESLWEAAVPLSMIQPGQIPSYRGHASNVSGQCTRKLHLAKPRPASIWAAGGRALLEQIDWDFWLGQSQKACMFQVCGASLKVCVCGKCTEQGQGCQGKCPWPNCRAIVTLCITILHQAIKKATGYYLSARIPVIQMQPSNLNVGFKQEVEKNDVKQCLSFEQTNN